MQLQTEQINCLLCASAAAKRLYNESYTLASSTAVLGINRCRSCGLVYVSPRLTPQSIQLVYERDAAQTISHNYCWDGSASRRRFARLLTRLAEVARPGKLLDVGCGGGQFLRAAQQTGRWQVCGIEPVAEAARLARKHAACEVEPTTLDRAAYAPHSFDVVTLLGVLEHVPDPVATLRQARNMLRSDGVLAAYVPNFNYLRWKDAGLLCYVRSKRWSSLHAQEHLFHYTPRTIRRLLETCGFEVLRIDVGRPFASRRPVVHAMKEAAYWATTALQRAAGMHLGGLEVLASVASTSQPYRMPRLAATRSGAA